MSNEIVNSCFGDCPYDLERSSLPKPYKDYAMILWTLVFTNASIIGLILAVLMHYGVI
jgi:hypothetical protein